MYHLFLLYSLTHEKIISIRNFNSIWNAEKHDGSRWMWTPLWSLWFSFKNVSFLFSCGNLGDKKEKGKRLLRETETSKISFDRVTECIFNLWINKYVVCNVQFVKNVLVPVEFMLYAWNRCSFSPLIIISHFLKSNERWFIPLLWP